MAYCISDGRGKEEGGRGKGREERGKEEGGEREGEGRAEKLREERTYTPFKLLTHPSAEIVTVLRAHHS